MEAVYNNHMQYLQSLLNKCKYKVILDRKGLIYDFITIWNQFMSKISAINRDEVTLCGFLAIVLWSWTLLKQRRK
jgi:hypothetical protein